MSQNQTAQNIADKLPGMVDKMTPEGDASALSGAGAGAGAKAKSMVQGVTDKLSGGGDNPRPM
jgi:hypothetical protein